VFADPQSVTYNGSAKSLPAVSRGEDKSVYRLVDSGVLYELTLSHSDNGKRSRAVARLVRTAAVADVLVPANNVVASMSATITVDFPDTGYTPTDAGYLIRALGGWLSASTYTAADKLLNFET